MGWARPASPGGAGRTTCWPLPPASCTRGHRGADTPHHRKTGLSAISCLPGAHVLMWRGSRNEGRFRAGRSLTGECGLQSDRPGRPHGQVRVRYWEAGQGPGWGPGQAAVGPLPGRTEPHSGVLPLQQDAVPGAGRVAQTTSTSAASRWRPWMEGPRPQPQPTPWPGTVSSGPPSSWAMVHMCTSVGTALRVAWGLQDGGRPEWGGWDPRACFPPC